MPAIPDPSPRPWLGRSLGVRSRAALVTVMIVGGAFVLSGYGVTSLLRGSLYNSATGTAEAQALAISSLVQNLDVRHAPLPVATDQMAAQLIDSRGNVVRSSMDIKGQPAMVDLVPPIQRFAIATGVVLRVKRFTHVHLDLDNRFVVVAKKLGTPTFSGTVLVAYSLGAADHAVAIVQRSLLIALPVLDLLVGLLVWSMTGWALRPVEDIRSEVAELSANDLGRRVPEPNTLDEIGRLARTMNAMLDRLEKSQEHQRQLVADVSHELRNPLAALRTQLEVALAHPGPTSSSMLEGSIADVTRMSQLVEDLLTLARLDEGILGLRQVDVDLDDLVLAQADRLRALGGADVSVQGVSAARARGDEAQLTRVLANLADNARRHARRRVQFAISRGSGFYDVSVTDDGPGVPWFERERIFERFVRLDSARIHDGTGAGLGLAIVREIVTAHGGQVWVEDAQPGARFVVRLPVPATTDGEPPRSFDASRPAVSAPANV